MADLEVKNHISPLQLAIVIVTMGVGVAGESFNQIFREAGHGAWLSVLAGGGLFYGVAWMMVKLGDMFPGESFVDYMPKIWGRPVGVSAVLLFSLVFVVQSAVTLHSFSREIAFFMFDRTPFEFIEATMLAVCVYCALQDLGTIVRVTQFVFFTALPVWLVLQVVSLINFQWIDVLPLWPVDIGGVIRGAALSWNLYAGYEIVLMLLPWVYQGNMKMTRAMAVAFGMTGVMFLFWTVLQTGVLTVDGAQKIPYPAMTVIRNVELPGTFVERLDTYFLLFWIQLTFVLIAVMLYGVARALAKLWGHADHRPWLIALVPILFICGDAAHNVRVYQDLDRLSVSCGLLLSLGVIPLTYGLVWWKKWKNRGAS